MKLERSDNAINFAVYIFPGGPMLGNENAIATIAVKSIDVGKKVL